MQNRSKMLAKLNTDCGPIEVAIDDCEAGNKFFRDLVTSRPRTVSFFRANRRVVALGPLGIQKRPLIGTSSDTRSINTENSSTKKGSNAFKRGTLAYAHNSTEIVLISRGSEFPHGAVVGKLAKPKSMHLIEEIANRPRQGESLTNPVKLSYECSAQLKELMEFESKLEKHLKSRETFKI